jgi:hypothetical protein
MNTVPLRVLMQASAALELCHKYHNDNPVEGQPFVETLRALSLIRAHIEAIAAVTAVEVET